MSYSKFSKVNSLFKTTLSQSISTSAASITLDSIPTGNVQYPNWIVIEPDSANAELVYLPTAPSGNTYSGVVRDISRSLDTDLAGSGVAHAANVEVVMAMTHRHWNELTDVMDGVNGTGAAAFRIGRDADENIFIYANNGDTDVPFLKYDSATSKWLVSNDGVNTFDPSTGGSGLSAGQGIEIAASVVAAKLNASGGLVKNLGAGTDELGVDPTVVARLDTANTWTNVQTLTADRLQVTTDPDSADDAVRKSWAETLSPTSYGDGSDGDVTVSAPTTLSRDMYYNNLTMSADIDAAGYSIFVKGTLTRTGTAKITNNGGNGGTGQDGQSSGSGTGGTAGTAGAAAPGITLPAGLPGKAGGAGVGTGGNASSTGFPGNAGTAGDSATSFVASNGAAGGAGGGTSNPNVGGTTTAGGSAGGAGTVTTPKDTPRNYRTAVTRTVIVSNALTVVRPSVGSGSGGSGAMGIGTTSQQGATGGGGGSGGSGGYVFVAARSIVDSGTGTMFQAVGGNGGNGGSPVTNNGTNAAYAGSGGGAGGDGGTIILIYSTLSGSAATDVAGGTGGTGSTGLANGVSVTAASGGNGSNGNAGVVYTLVL